jgi:hypothetical protein
MQSLTTLGCEGVLFWGDQLEAQFFVLRRD